MRIHILGSGSRGNAIVLESPRERVLVDAGFGPRITAQRMRRAGVAPESVAALIVTHEHGDHFAGAAASAARWRWRVYGTPGTLRSYVARHGDVHRVDTRRDLALSDFTIQFVRTPHDAREPVALIATARSTGARIGIAYDLGHVTTRFASHFEDLDALLLESNYDEEMLRSSSYPGIVKARIASARGHLSNSDAGAMARSCSRRGLRHLVLCHLSETANHPTVALATVRAALQGSGFRGALHAAPPDAGLTVDVGRARHGGQLSLDL
jgi:phosphoribosyl 1,2-cyclic phosphodiesterase